METGDSGALRILVLVPFAPRLDSPHGGRATAEFLVRLARRHELGLLCLRDAGEAPSEEALQEVCAFVEEVELPERAENGAAATLRRLRLLSQLLRSVPMQAVDWGTSAYARRLRAAASSFEPDVVHLEPFAMAQYLDVLDDCAAPRVVVEHEPVVQAAFDVVHSSRGVEKIVRRLDLRAWKRFERVAMQRVDAVVALTEPDRQVIAQEAQGRRVVQIPLGVQIPDVPLDPIGTSPPSLLFVGGFGHPPNVDAGLRLARGILPRVWERRAEVVLYLVGDLPPEGIRELANDRIVVTGRVPDVRPFLDRAAVVVAPLRLGGGMRNKVLEALAAGKAVVASPRAAAGLDVTDGEQLRLADEDAEFAAAIVELLENAERRRELAARARAWAEASLGWDDRVAAFEALYRSLSRGSAPMGRSR